MRTRRPLGHPRKECLAGNPLGSRGLTEFFRFSFPVWRHDLGTRKDGRAVFLLNELDRRGVHHPNGDRIIVGISDEFLIAAISLDIDLWGAAHAVEHSLVK